MYARTENDDTRRKPLLSEVKQELGADDGNRTRVLSLGSFTLRPEASTVSRSNAWFRPAALCLVQQSCNYFGIVFAEQSLDARSEVGCIDSRVDRWRS